MAVNENLLREKVLKEMEFEAQRLKENKSDVVSRQSQVDQECKRLANEIDKLHEAISYLEDRLSSVLRYSDPKPEDVEKTESLVKHAEFIRGKSWMILAATERVTDILQRLEL